jgi:type II secretory pathway pseudopilin PulG
VVGIIALMLAILLPSLSRARRQARRTVCMACATQLAKTSGRQTIRLQLQALDCGCYGELNGDLGVFTGTFRLPDGMDESAYRQFLQAELLKAK